MSSEPDRSRRLEHGRTNQKRRTRQALLDACARLLEQGATPTLAEDAAEALVSRATAYRYFPSVEAAVEESFFERELPTAGQVFSEEIGDPVERVLRVEKELNDVLFANEVSTHVVVRNIVDVWLASPAGDRVARPGRRVPLLDAALEPLAEQLGRVRLLRLRNALALAIGTEAVLALRDVCGLDPDAAREVTRWTVVALVRQALQD